MWWVVKAYLCTDTVLESERMLVRYRYRLQEDFSRCKVRIKSLLRYAGIHLLEDISTKYWSAAYIKWIRDLDIQEPSTKKTLDYMIDEAEALRSQLLKVMRDIRTLLQSEWYKNNATYLMSVCGIGQITAITLLTEVGDIKRFGNFNRFNSFIGFCPSEFSSGEHTQHGHITVRHHHLLRKLLIEASWIAIKKDPALSLAYNDLKKRMGGKRAIIRIARKLLNRIYSCWLRERMYEIGIMQ